MLSYFIIEDNHTHRLASPMLEMEKGTAARDADRQLQIQVRFAVLLAANPDSQGAPTQQPLKNGLFRLRRGSRIECSGFERAGVGAIRHSFCLRQKTCHLIRVEK